MGRDRLVGMLLGALLVVLLGTLVGALTKVGGAPGPTVGGCTTYRTTEVGDEKYLWAGGQALQVLFEPDAEGGDTGAEVTLYSCSQPANADSCEEYYFDSDFDGAPDASVMDGSSWPFEGRTVSVQVAGWLRIETTTAVGDPDTDVAEWTVCGLGTGGEH